MSEEPAGHAGSSLMAGRRGPLQQHDLCSTHKDLTFIQPSGESDQGAADGAVEGNVTSRLRIEAGYFKIWTLSVGLCIGLAKRA